jgi:hypothetical protein
VVVNNLQMAQIKNLIVLQSFFLPAENTNKKSAKRIALIHFRAKGNVAPYKITF